MNKIRTKEEYDNWFKKTMKKLVSEQFKRTPRPVIKKFEDDNLNISTEMPGLKKKEYLIYTNLDKGSEE